MKKIISALFIVCLFACKGANNSPEKPTPTPTPTPSPQDQNTFEVGNVKIEMASVDAISEIVLGHASSTDNKPHKVSLCL